MKRRKYTNEELLATAPVSKALLALIGPAVLGILVQLVYNVTDTFFVGLMDDYAQVAAVSLAFPVTLLMGALGSLFSAGAPAYLSRLLGEGKREDVKSSSVTALYGTVGVALLFSLGVLLFLEPVLRLIGASEATMGPGKIYLAIICLGSAASMAQGTMQGLLRAEGSAKLATAGSVLGVAVNIALDPLFILGFGWGVAGAAAATVVGNAVSLAYFIVQIKGKAAFVSISPRDFKLKKENLLGMLSVGTPAAVAQAVTGVTVFFTINFAAGYSDYFLAASMISSKVYSVTLTVAMGISMGIQPFIGYQFGSGNRGRMKEGLRFSLVLGTGFCLACGLLFLLLGEQAVRIFSSDEQVVSIGIQYMNAFLLSVPFLAVQQIALSFLQATGRASQAMAVNISRQLVIFLPVLFLFTSLFGQDSLPYTQPVSDLAATALAAALALRAMKKLGKTGRKPAVEEPYAAA